MAGYFYNAIVQNIAMVKNDTMAFGFQVKGFKGQTPSGIYFTCKDNVNSSLVLFQRTLDNGIVLESYDPVSDTLTYKVRVNPEATLNIPVGRYYYDLEIHVNKDTFTLLKGMLTIDWEVTAKDNEEPTPGDDGDNIYYPVADPEGKKEYSETYISSIAEGILDINDAAVTYRVSDMVGALSAIRGKLDDISDAINTKTGGSSLIPLNDMAAAIASIQTGLPLIDYMSNLAANLAAVWGYSTYGFWFLKTSDDHYLLAIISGEIQIQLKLGSASRGVLSWLINITNDSHSYSRSPFNASLYPTGKSDYYPIDSTELSVVQDINSGDYGTLSSAPFYNRDNVFYGLSETNLPRTLSVLANRNVVTMKNFIEGFKFGDYFTNVVSGATDAYLLYIDAWDNVINLCTITSDSNRFYYNRTSGQFIIQRCYWARPTSFNYSASKQNISGQQSSSGYYAYTMTIEQLEAAIYFNSCDILDENGDLVIPANCTPEDLGIS